MWFVVGREMKTILQGASFGNSGRISTFIQSLSDYHAKSERLVSWVQLGIVASFTLLYIASPKAAGSVAMFEPVPWALAAYSVFTIMRLRLSYTTTLGKPFLTLSILVDMAVVYGLVWTFHLQYGQPPVFYLKAPTLMYVFIFIALRALRLEVYYVATAGLAAAAGWLALVLLAIAGHPSGMPLVTHDYVEYLTSLRLLWGAEIDKIISIAAVSAVLSIAVSRAREILNKEQRASEVIEEHRQRLYEAAYFDTVTGLPQVNWLIENEPENSGGCAAVVNIRFNNLRLTRATLGFDFGDQALFHAAAAIKARAPANAILARTGDNELSAILPGASEPEIAAHVAEGLRQVFEQPLQVENRKIYQKVQFGIAFWQTPDTSLSNAIRHAAIASVQSDQAITQFDDTMRAKAVEFTEIEAGLRSAIEKPGEIHPHYQPILDLKTGAPVGFEALARWDSQARGFVSPADFIPVAEATGLIVPIGLQMLEQSVIDLKAIAGNFEQEQNLFVSVNLSPRQLEETDCVNQISDIIRRHDFAPERLRLELTESSDLESNRNATEKLTALRALGVQLSIDDFGTGYSSLSYLHALPFDTLKIDRSFVDAMCKSEESLELVKAIIGVAKTFKLNIVAEGIERAEEAARLLGLECDYGQGYFYSKPLKKADVIDWLEAADIARPIEADKLDAPLSGRNIV